MPPAASTAASKDATLPLVCFRAAAILPADKPFRKRGSNNWAMSSERDRLQSLVDALPDSYVQVAISLKDRPGELRLRAGKWRVFFCLEPPDLIRVLGIDDNRGEAY